MNALFETHLLNDQGLAKARKLGDLFDTLLREVEALNPRDGRELALVKTHLESACFFAKKALAMHPENQKT